MRNSLTLVSIWLVLLLAACDVNNEIAPTSNETVPPAAIAALRQEFPTTTTMQFKTIELDRVWQANFNFVAAVMTVYVNNGGKIYEASQETSLVSLPSTIQSYLQQVYPTASFLGAGTSLTSGAVNGYKVAIHPTQSSAVQTLLFNAQGTIILDAGSTEGNVANYLIGMDDLPAAAKTVLTGWTFVKGLAYNVDGKPQYRVLATKGNDRKVFIFDETGKLLKSYADGTIKPASESKSIGAGDVPASVKEYLNQNYAGWVFVKATRRSESGQVVRYIVVFTSGTSTFTGEFDGQGKLLGVSKI